MYTEILTHMRKEHDIDIIEREYDITKSVSQEILLKKSLLTVPKLTGTGKIEHLVEHEVLHTILQT